MLDRLFGFRRQAPEKAFWEWFTENSERYRAFEIGAPDQDRLFADLDRALHKVHRNLQFAFNKGNQTERELIISADGDRDLIPVVWQLVEAAPPLPGWKIIPFRPRMSAVDSIQLQFGDIELDASSLWFLLSPEDDRIGLDIYLAGFDDVRSQSAYFAAFILLDYALGEYDVMTRVGTITTYPLPPDPEGLKLKPYPQLPEEFDALYKLMNH